MKREDFRKLHQAKPVQKPKGQPVLGVVQEDEPHKAEKKKEG